MIYESGPWRRDLLRDADVLDRWLSKRSSERRSVIIEKKVFMGAYMMRRLLQSEKLSTSTETRNVKVDRFPSKFAISKEGRWDVDIYYDFPEGCESFLPIPKLLNLIIHSFIFQEWHDESENETKVVFTSDKTRNQFLWLLNLSSFVKIMRFVAMDDPNFIVLRRDTKSGQMIEWRGTRDPHL